MLQQIQEMDAMMTPIRKVYANSRGQNLFENEGAMTDFLERPYSEGGCDAWLTETGNDWYKMYHAMVDTYRQLKTPDAQSRRAEFEENGLTDIFETAYACLQGDLKTSSLRKPDDQPYIDAFNSYTEELLAAITLKFDLSNTDPAPFSFESQIISKIRFLTKDVGNRFSPRPLFCLSYALDCCTEWLKYERSIREVRMSFTCLPQHDMRIRRMI